MGENDLIVEQLLKKTEKHREMFSKICALGGSLAYAILSKSMNLKLSFLLRCHAPVLTTRAAIKFDEMVLESAVSICRLAGENAANPSLVKNFLFLSAKEGGGGLTNLEELAPIAFRMSSEKSREEVDQIGVAHSSPQMSHRRSPLVRTSPGKLVAKGLLAAVVRFHPTN